MVRIETKLDTHAAAALEVKTVQIAHDTRLQAMERWQGRVNTTFVTAGGIGAALASLAAILSPSINSLFH